MVEVTYGHQGGAQQTQQQCNSGQCCYEEFDDIFDSFSDEVPNQQQPSEEEVQQGRSILNSFLNFIKGNRFKAKVNAKAEEYGIPPKRIAQNFFENVLGTLGDILGIAINTACNAMHAVIDIVSAALHGAVNILCKVANGIASVVTLNRTVTA